MIKIFLSVFDVVYAGNIRFNDLETCLNMPYFFFLKIEPNFFINSLIVLYSSFKDRPIP